MDGLEQFKTYLINNDRKYITWKKHLYVLARLLKISPTLDSNEIINWLASKKEAGMKNNALNTIIQTIRCYAHFKGREDLLQIKYHKRDKTDRTSMSDEEVEAFLKMKKPYDWHKKSFEMYTEAFRIMFFTGLRPTETVNLTVDDIDFGLKTIKVRNLPFSGKTVNSIGDVPLPENIIPHLQKYIEKIGNRKHLFPSQRGGNGEFGGVLDGACLAVHFKKRINYLGIKRQGLVPKSARHTYGTRLADIGTNLYTLKNLMRHSKITTTEIYLHDSLKQRRDAQDKLPLVLFQTEPEHRLQHTNEVLLALNYDKDVRFRHKLVLTQHSLEFKVSIRKEFRKRKRKLTTFKNFVVIPPLFIFSFHHYLFSFSHKLHDFPFAELVDAIF